MEGSAELQADKIRAPVNRIDLKRIIIAFIVLLLNSNPIPFDNLGYFRHIHAHFLQI